MKFKKVSAGEYKAVGIYNGKKAVIEATAQSSGGFVWSSYLDGHYMGGDGAFPLYCIKQNLNDLSYFFD